LLTSTVQDKRKKLLILPPVAILYFACSILIVLLVLACIDRIFLPDLVRRGQLASQDWRDQDGRNADFIGQRNLASKDNAIWRSSLLPVSEDAHGKHRIFVSGDSFVWGDGVTNVNDIWWRQLQFELQRRGYNDVEVIASGLCGYSTRMQLQQAEKLLPKYKPDMCVFGYVTNDPDEGSDWSGHGNVKQLKAGPDDSAFTKSTAWFASIFPQIAYQLRDLRSRNLMSHYTGDEKNGYTYAVWEKKILEGKNFEDYTRTVHSLSDLMKNSGIPSCVVTLPMPVERFRELYVPVAKLFQDSGLTFFNLYEPMMDWFKKKNLPLLSLAVTPTNGHPSLLAAHFYAVQTADILEKNYPQVLGPKTESRTKEAPGLEIIDYVPWLMSVKSLKPGLFALYYPPDPKDFLVMPLQRPYVQLNLAKPTALKELHVLGKDLGACSLAVRSGDPDRMWETAAIHEIGSKKGKTCIFKLPADLKSIDEVMLSANLTGQDNRLVVEFVSR
jgi:hypothetical protein